MMLLAYTLPLWFSLACLGTVLVICACMCCSCTLQVYTAIATALHFMNVKALFMHRFGLASHLLISLDLMFMLCCIAP